jgi:16S rRNA processing protein RimM
MTAQISASTVLKPRGLKGELKCVLIPFDVQKVIIEGVKYDVLMQKNSDFTYLFLQNVNDLNAAERLRGKKIEIDRAEIKLEKDEILTCDLVGFSVVDERGKNLGTVRDFANYGAGDIVDCGGFSIPYEDEFIIETNIKKRTLVVRPLLND